MNKKTFISLFIATSLFSMDKPLDRLLSLLPGRKTPQASPRTDISPCQEPIPHNNASPQTPDDCIIFANLALEIDHLYRNSKEIIEPGWVENAYIKALKCFVQTYEENRKDVDLQLKKLHALYLQIELEKKQQNLSHAMSSQTLELNNKIRDLVKRYVIKGGTHV